MYYAFHNQLQIMDWYGTNFDFPLKSKASLTLKQYHNRHTADPIDDGEFLHLAKLQTSRGTRYTAKILKTKISCENVVTSLNATDTWNTPTVSNLSCNPITNWVSNPLPVCCFEVCLLILTSVLTKALRKLPNNCWTTDFDISEH